MSYCATCGRQREGTARFCGGCGTEYTDRADDGDADQADDQAAPPPGATRLDLAVGVSGVSAGDGADGADGKPDPFAGWYQPQAPRTPPDGPRDAGEYWQPTETVQATPARAGGYPSPPAAPPPPPYQPGPYQPGQAPGRPERGGRRSLFVAVAVVVVLAAGGGAYALASSLGKHPVAQPTGGPSVSTSASTPVSGSTSRTGSAPAATPSASASPTATPSPSLSLVAVAPGVPASSVRPPVETLLSHYFHGINSHSYAEYSSTLNSAQKARQSESVFTSGFGTTTDSGMTLTSLASTGSGLTATVTFTSHQSAAQSVDKSTCNDWTLNLYLVPAGTGYLIGPAPSGYQPNYSDC